MISMRFSARKVKYHRLVNLIHRIGTSYVSNWASSIVGLRSCRLRKLQNLATPDLRLFLALGVKLSVGRTNKMSTQYSRIYLLDPRKRRIPHTILKNHPITNCGRTLPCGHPQANILPFLFLRYQFEDQF